MAAANRESQLLSELNTAKASLQPTRLRAERLAEENRQLQAQLKELEGDMNTKVCAPA